MLSELERFLAETEVPSFVARAFHGYLDCGLLTKGFVRVTCRECKEESLVAFSCNDRGFCPSCTARRAAQTAAHLVDEVIPHVPVRQWVLAFPFDLHHRLARNAALEARLLSLFIEELTEHLREAAGQPDGVPGTVTFLQHFGSTLNLHVHLHVLSLDGVYVDQDGAPAFRRASQPTREQLEAMVSRIATRARKLAGQSEPDAEPVLMAPDLKLHGAPPDDVPDEPRRAAEHDGFNLHASAPLEAHERVALERLCRYALRGPLALGRLSDGPRDKLVYRLKTPRRDGTTHLVLSPMALLQRLSWLVPLPRIHMVRYHGVLAPNHAWRRLVVVKPRAKLPGAQRHSSCRWIVVRQAHHEGHTAPTGVPRGGARLLLLRRGTTACPGREGRSRRQEDPGSSRIANDCAPSHALAPRAGAPLGRDRPRPTTGTRRAPPTDWDQRYPNAEASL